jgi:hypothetical protein
MTTPYLPPYLGSYEHLVQALLHNPFLGSGHPGPHPRIEALERQTDVSLPQDPVPVHPNAAVNYLASLVSMKELAKAVPDKDFGAQLAGRADAALGAFMDDFCGTPPRRIPWPYPGPPPWVSPLVAQLLSVANAQSGALRDGLMAIAGKISQFSAQSSARSSER